MDRRVQETEMSPAKREIPDFEVLIETVTRYMEAIESGANPHEIRSIGHEIIDFAIDAVYQHDLQWTLKHLDRMTFLR
jgi:hypothetical protein